jgi:arylsulfatase A-like enzyme
MTGGRARALLAALLAVLGGGCGPSAPRAQPSPGAPSVLLVSIDTLRADRVGAYGASDGATPAIDALAAEGLRFEKAISPAPLTLPAHATLLTGLLPPRHGVRHNGLFRLAEEHETLAERFRAAGYATGAVVGAVVLARRYGLDQGFDHYDDAIAGAKASPTGYPERSAVAVTDAALGWLAERAGPFFLFVHYYDPHAEYQPPPELAARFPGRPYEAEIAAADAGVARLVAALRDAGRLDTTLVAVTSDHGESLGEHGERTHSYTLYDATLAVPLVLRGPGVPRGRSAGGVVSLASVAPTLLHLAGLAPLLDPDGEDLVARFESPAPSGGEAYAETLATQLDHGWAPLHALRTPSHHYVRAPRPELYEVARDPGERRNLLAEGPRPEAQALGARVESLLARAAPLRRAPLDPGTEQQLRALGYAVTDAPVPATGLDPKDGLRLVELYVEARSAFHAGDLARAEARARELVAASPQSGQGHLLLSGLARQRGDLRAALAEAERAARLVPQAAAYPTEVGDLRLELGDVPGALAAYDAALTVDPEQPEARAGTMWRAALSKDPADAATAAAAAAALRPDDARLRLRIAQTFERLGDPERALEACRAALAIDAGLEAAHMGAAIALARLGRDGELEPHLAAAGPYAAEPSHRNRLAIAFATRGETARAEALFRAALAEHPDHAGTRRNLAHLLRSTGRAAEAARLEPTPATGG